MGIEAKIHLSKLETELIKNKEWILTKHAIINKVYKLFGELNEIYKQVSEQEEAFFRDFIKMQAAKFQKEKITKGFLMLCWIIRRCFQEKIFLQ